MERLPLHSTAAVSVEPATRTHVPDVGVLNLDGLKKLANGRGALVPGCDGEGDVVFENILKHRRHFWKGIGLSPVGINNVACVSMEGGNDIFVTIEGPQSVVAVKDQKGLLLRHWRGTFERPNGPFQIFRTLDPWSLWSKRPQGPKGPKDQKDQKATNINTFYTIPIMRVFYLMSFNEKFNKTFDTLQELIRYYDKHSSTYTHYIFAIPLL